MFAADLMRRLNDQPFKPFRVHLSDGSVLDVLEPRMVIVSPTTAVIPTQWTRDEPGKRLAQDWRTIILLHMTQFSDLPTKPNGSKRRRK